jgi:hypothetical protein
MTGILPVHPGVESEQRKEKNSCTTIRNLPNLELEDAEEREVKKIYIHGLWSLFVLTWFRARESLDNARARGVLPIKVEHICEVKARRVA